VTDKDGDAIRKLRSPQQSLRNWTNQEWTTKSGRNSSETGERYLPKKAIQNLSDAEYQRTSRAKREGMKDGRQFVPQPAEIAKKTARYR
jgi:hypothetical protein